MWCLTHRIIVLVFFCVGFLSIQPETASASRNIDLALTWGRGGGGGRLLLRSPRILKAAAALEETNMPFNIAPSPAMTFDPNQSEKRTVRGGSDPIHNRS
ncbi:hypothetical protein C2S51_018674 [Perilla frutescens var. frutescens]|nr:hypothetical protein C2S51_018674 [Perilla frutescens var. frutescens]